MRQFSERHGKVLLELSPLAAGVNKSGLCRELSMHSGGRYEHLARINRVGIGDQGPGRIQLVPDVPEERSSHPALPAVREGALAIWLLPLGHNLGPGIDISNRLVAQIEHIRVEEGEMLVGLPFACHRSSREATHRRGVVLVFDAATLTQR